MKTAGKILCVVRASGLVRSNIVEAGLDRDYTVHGTMRDKDAPSKVPFLNALAGASERLSLFSADMSKEETFDEAMAGADCVFIACLIPTYVGPSGKPAREMDDDQGYAEIIMPTANGCLNIMVVSQGWWKIGELA